MKKAQNVTTISGADGPTAYYVLSKDRKLTLKQKVQKLRFNMRRAWIKKRISANSHSMEEVCQYIQDK